MILKKPFLNDLIEHIEYVFDGSRKENVIFISGEAGSGKTTILNSLKEDLTGHLIGKSNKKPLIAYTACSTPLSGKDIGELEALYPWIQIMSELTTRKKKNNADAKKLIFHLAKAWVRLIPIIGQTIESVADTVILLKEHTSKTRMIHENKFAINKQQVFQQYIDFLEKLSEKYSVILLIDDFQWADDSSTDLLFTAARKLENQPIIFLIAYRPEDAINSRGHEGHPMIHIMNELSRNSKTKVFTIPSYDHEDVNRLLKGILEVYEDNSEFEKWLSGISNGNILYMTEYIKLMLLDGYIDKDGKILKEYEKLRVPESLQAVLQEKLSRMDEDTKELLRYASVEGEVFSLMVLSTITNTDNLKLLQKLRIIEDTHKTIKNLGKQNLYFEETIVIQFSSLLIQKLLYGSLGLEEKELLHREIFNILVKEWAKAKETGGFIIKRIAARLTVHASLLGEHLFSAGVMLEWAKESWKEFSEEETLKQIQEIEILLDKSTPRDEKERNEYKVIKADTSLLKGGVNLIKGRFSRTLDCYNLAIKTYEEYDDIKNKTIVLTKKSHLFYIEGNYTDSKIIGEEALAISEKMEFNEGIEKSCVSLGMVSNSTGNHEEAKKYFERSLKINESEQNAYNSAVSMFHLSRTYLFFYDFINAEKLIRHCLKTFEATNDYFRNLSLWTLGDIQKFNGDFEDSVKTYSECLTYFEKNEFKFMEIVILFNLGDAYAKSGQYEKAMELNVKVLAITNYLSLTNQKALILHNIGDIHYIKKEYDKALEFFQKSLTESETAKDIRKQIDTLKRIGSIYRISNNLEESRKYLEKAYQFSVMMNDLINQADIKGELGLLAESEARLYEDGNNKSEKIKNALFELDMCVKSLDRLVLEKNLNLKYWELVDWTKELSRVKEQYNII